VFRLSRMNYNHRSFPKRVTLMNAAFAYCCMQVAYQQLGDRVLSINPILVSTSSSANANHLIMLSTVLSRHQPTRVGAPMKDMPMHAMSARCSSAR